MVLLAVLFHILTHAGVTIQVEPPIRGTVYDGPYPTEDINYQVSLTEFAANWQDCKYCVQHQLVCGPCFGAGTVDKGLSIAWYSVALGSNANFDRTKANIMPFTNVGLNTSVVFRFAKPLAPLTRYYFTVRGYSMLDVYNQATSSGIIGGFTLALQAGVVVAPAYLSSLDSLSFSWSGFSSVLPIYNYDVWVASASNTSQQITVPVSVGTNEQAVLTNLSGVLMQAGIYVVCVKATDQSVTSNTTCSKAFVVDLTPPCVGQVLHSNSHLSPALTVSYESNAAVVALMWRNFSDNESGIARYDAVFLSSSTCTMLGELNLTTALQPHPCDPGHVVSYSTYLDTLPWKAVGDQTQTNFTLRLSQSENLRADGRYMLLLRVVNNAGLTSVKASPVIVLDASIPMAGTVKVGNDFRQNVQYQNSNTSMAAAWTHAFLPTQLDCPNTNTYYFATADPAWSTVSRYCRNGQCGTSFPANTNLLADQLAFDPNRVVYDIRGLAISLIPRRSGVFYTGSLVTQLPGSVDGVYSFRVQPAAGLDVINSIFWWSGDPQQGLREPVYNPGDADTVASMVLAPVVSYDAMGVASTSVQPITALGLQLQQVGNSSSSWLAIVWFCENTVTPTFRVAKLDWDLSTGYSDVRLELATGLERGVKTQGDLYVNNVWRTRFFTFPSIIAAYLGFTVYPGTSSVNTAPLFRIAQATIPAASNRLCKVWPCHINYYLFVLMRVVWYRLL